MKIYQLSALKSKFLRLFLTFCCWTSMMGYAQDAKKEQEGLKILRDLIINESSKEVKKRAVPSPIPSFNVQELETQVRQLFEKSYRAVPIIYAVDSQGNNIASFSGVVVDSAGHVLTAAHCIIPEASTYRIVFPDGLQCSGRVLGVFEGNDMAMMQINEKGSWPYAPMGWSTSLKKDMPCLAISYPGGARYGEFPTLRLGYIVNTPDQMEVGSYVITSSSLQKGDSGGPDFDLLGRVIGIHSRIVGIDQGKSVPIDLFRRHWQALLKPQRYKQLPADQGFPDDAQAKSLSVFYGIDRLNEAPSLKSVIGKDRVFRLKAKDGVSESNILATLVDLSGSSKSYLISKSSVTADNPKLTLASGEVLQGKVVERDRPTDLSLIELEKKIAGGIKMDQMEKPLKQSDLGKLLVSPFPGAEGLAIGVLGHMPIKIPETVGFYAEVDDGAVRATKTDQTSKIRAAGLKEGDELLEIGGAQVQTLGDVQDELLKYEPGEEVEIKFSRAGMQHTKKIVLQKSLIAPLSSEAVDELLLSANGGSSSRMEGFRAVALQDAKVKPEECGGPVFGLDGRFYGLNIAKANSTVVLMVPVIYIKDFLQAYLQKNKHK